MRLDKYLKVSRIIKRRTLAKEICEGGKVSINGKVAKPATEVAVGDELVIRFPSRTFAVTIVQIRENVPAKEAAELYRMKDSPRA